RPFVSLCVTQDKSADHWEQKARSRQLLKADRIFRSRRSRLARQRRPDDPAMLVELHAQRQSHLHQNVLDLIERLAAEVLGLEHFIFALLHEFTNSLDIRVL